MKNYFKKLLGITDLESKVAQLEYSNKMLHEENNKIYDLVKEFTRVDGDIGIRGNNTIVLTGVFNGQGYVRFYDVGDGEFRDMVNRLKDMKKYSLVRNIDQPPNFMSLFDFEMSK